MLTKPRQVVVDKDAFIGINLDELCNLAKRCVLVLPDTLLYECATTDKDEQSRLIGRFEELASAGSHACTSIEAMIRYEAKYSSPYGPIGAKQGEYEIRMDAQCLQTRRARYDDFVRQLTMVVEGWHDELSKKNPDLLAAVRTWDASTGVRPARLNSWFEFVDSQDMHEWSRKLFEGITEVPERFCTSDEWVAWHFSRLYGVIFLEHAFLTHKGGPPGATTLEHDLQDIFYVTLLCRADGLLSRDQKLVQPLARAAFPEKKVFSSLEDVPRDWATG